MVVARFVGVGGLGVVLGGGVGVVLGLVGLGGCPWWGSVVLGSLYVAVSRTRGVPPPLGDGRGFSFGFNSFGVGWLAFCLKKKKKKKKLADSCSV